MSIQKAILKHKGNYCEATLFCMRRPIGSVIAIPVDKEDNELGRFGIKVCRKHRREAMQVANEWAKKYEAEYASKNNFKEAK